MQLTIKSRKLDKDVTFFSAGSHKSVYVDLNGLEGNLGNQVCEKGFFFGDAVSSGAFQEDFELTCRKWFAKYLVNLEEVL